MSPFSLPWNQWCTSLCLTVVSVQDKGGNTLQTSILCCLQIETPSGTLGPFCGHAPPASPFLTHSHHVRIHFSSDGFGTNKGFALHFKTQGTAASSPVTRQEKNVWWKLMTIYCSFPWLIADKTCPTAVTPHSTAAPQQAEYVQGQTVTVTCDIGYVVNNVSVQSDKMFHIFMLDVYESLSSQFISSFCKTGRHPDNVIRVCDDMPGYGNMDSQLHLWTWGPLPFCPPRKRPIILHCLFNIWSFLPHIFSHVAVDCGKPDIPKDGILHLVGSENPNTKYKAQIHVNCSSDYYKLEGDGDYRKLVCSPFLFLWLK